MNDANSNDVRKDEDFVSAQCPSNEDVCAFVERRLPAPQMAAVAEHVAACDGCRERIADLAEWLADGLDGDSASSSEDMAAARKALETAGAVRRGMDLWRRLADAVAVRSRECLAAADGQTADQVQRQNAMAAELHFVSNPPPPHRNAWHVKATLPMDMFDEANVRFQIFDGEDHAMPSGVLTFCGIDLGIEEGYAFMSMSEFRRNLHVPAISFSQDGGESVEGEFCAAYGI